MDNAEDYWITATAVTRLDGARDKKQVWRPHFRTWGLSEANVLHWSTCDIARIFRRPRNCGLCPPVITPLFTARSDAPQQTMVLSSNQRHTGTFALGWAYFQFARIFAPLWGKRIGKFCRAMILLKQLDQTYQEVFPESFSSCPNLRPHLIRLYL